MTPSDDIVRVRRHYFIEEEHCGSRLFSRPSDSKKQTHGVEPNYFQHGKTAYGGATGYWTATARICIRNEKTSIFWSPLSTEADDTAADATPQKTKKQDRRARPTVSSVGRKIPYNEVSVISEEGKNLGVMQREEVLQVMDQKGLKLVVLAEHQDPPVYRLMSGKQIHEEQMREKQKARAALVQIKELTFSIGIASHDLTTKLKQVENWLEKKHHVRITLRAQRKKPTDNLDKELERMLEQIEAKVGFVYQPKLVHKGQAAICVLRPPSAKELSKKQKDRTSLPSSDSSQAAKEETSSPDTKQESIKQ
ncbi:translation initiation factor IF-3, mitochondrial [Nerophis ophidion]|uniref:translation initiation factor IF-3, mitochondrial n=1 Tax=Nerophis ophidion TaxID=159077 RepID=UPI002ADF3E00|nr:translation initiation factor IF-3, mitochondrial [Nerophis ophidion]